MAARPDTVHDRGHEASAGTVVGGRLRAGGAARHCRARRRGVRGDLRRRDEQLREQQVIRTARLIILLARPAVVVLFGMYSAVGMAAAGQPDDPLLLARALVVVAAFVVFAISVNDLADEAIDRVNLAGDRRRPLVVGTANRRQMRLVAGIAAAFAVGGGVTLGGPTVLVIVGGLMFAAAYSLPPWRLASRGIVAPLLLPAGYIAVPYLTGVFAVRPSLTERDLALAAGLYVGFIGRIILKDFRDVRGDQLFGKRTWLVRHGRVATCKLSAACWTAGTAIVVATARRSLAFAVSELAILAATLVLLRTLASDRGHRRDESLISSIAICGRAVILVLLAHLTLVRTDWSTTRIAAVLAALTIILLGQARTMARHGPPLRPAPHWAQRSRDQLPAGASMRRAQPSALSAELTSTRSRVDVHHSGRIARRSGPISTAGAS